MSVVGIDLSMTSTGLCAINTTGISALHTVTSKGGRQDSLEKRRDRLWGIANEVTEWVEAFHPELVVIEAPSYGSRFGSAHDRSGLWWMVAGPLSHYFPLAQVAPQARAKYGTGAGNSEKKVVYAFVKDAYEGITPRRIKNNDEADAILLAAMGARHMGYPVERGGIEDINLTSMVNVAWPTV